jgi:hypothetical protein
MAHGMIPVISEETNIDLEEWGIPLPDSRIDALRSSAIRASRSETDLIQKMLADGVESTKTRYSIDNFRKNFSEAIEVIAGFPRD